MFFYNEINDPCFSSGDFALYMAEIDCEGQNVVNGTYESFPDKIAYYIVSNEVSCYEREDVAIDNLRILFSFGKCHFTSYFNRKLFDISPNKMYSEHLILTAYEMKRAALSTLRSFCDAIDCDDNFKDTNTEKDISFDEGYSYICDNPDYSYHLHGEDFENNEYKIFHNNLPEVVLYFRERELLDILYNGKSIGKSKYDLSKIMKEYTDLFDTMVTSLVDIEKIIQEENEKYEEDEDYEEDYEEDEEENL